MSTAQIVSNVWSFCNALRDDGVGYVWNCEPIDLMNTMKEVNYTAHQLIITIKVQDNDQRKIS